jgi:hypothetical protein
MIMASPDARPVDYDLLVERVAQSVERATEGFGFLRSNAKSVGNMVRGTLCAYTTEHLTEMNQLLSIKGELSQGIAEQVARNRREELVVDTMRLYPILGVQNYNEAEALLKSVGHYPQLPLSGSVTESPDEVRRQSIALMKVTKTIMDEVGSGTITESPDAPALAFLYRTNRAKTFMLANDSMVSLVMDDPDRVDDICAIIREHGTAEAQFIGGILESIAPSLADGAL